MPEEKIKVVHLISGLGIGGAEKMLFRLIRDMDQSRFDNTVVSLTDMGSLGSKMVEQGVSVMELGMRPALPLPSDLLKLRWMIRTIKPDLIQGWMYHGNLAATLSSGALSSVRADRIPILWNIRQTLYEIEKEKWMTGMVIRAGSRLSYQTEIIIYNSKVSRKQHENFGYASPGGVVIPNGFDLDLYRLDSGARHLFRRELGVEENKILIGHLARFHPMKRHDVFLRAVSLVPDENIVFLLAGNGVDYDNASLMELIKKYELSERVHLLGGREDIPGLMASLDILATSSGWGEAFPNVVGEAMACGVPCVVTDVGDSAYIVGDTGAVVRPDDPHALATEIRKFIRLSPEGRNTLGQRARQRIRDKFNLPEVVKCYEDLFEEMATTCAE